MLVFACISPHPPIILPTVGSATDRERVRSTISALSSLAPKLASARPEIIIISSPHPDWGIQVPLHFLMNNLKFKIFNPSINTQDCPERSRMDNFQSISNLQFLKIENSAVSPILTTLDSPANHYKFGKQIASKIPEKRRWAWIASGDMSHCLLPEGPYGFNPAGPKFDKTFIELLKNKNVKGILNMDPELVEGAGECGLRSFCMLLGALEGAKVNWRPEILSYEGPFGVGYLVANIQINTNQK